MAVYITKNGRLQMARLFRSAIGGVRYNHLTATSTNSNSDDGPLLLDGATNGLLEAPGLSDGKAKGSSGGGSYPEYSKGYEGAVGSGDRGVTGFYIALGYDPRHNIAVNNEYVLDNRTWLFAHRIFPSLEVGSTSAPSLPFTAFVNYCVPYGEASANELASSDGSAVVNGTSYLLLKDTYVDAAGALSYGGGGNGTEGGDNGYNGLLDRESGVRTPVLLYVSVVLSASLIQSAMARIGYGTPEGVSETNSTILDYPDMWGRLNPAQRFNMVGYFMFNAPDDRYYEPATGGNKFVKPTVAGLTNLTSYKASKIWMQFKKRATDEVPPTGVAPRYQAADSSVAAAQSVVNALYADDLFIGAATRNRNISYIVSGSTECSSGWLSATDGGDALTPQLKEFYIVVTVGDFKDKVYQWSGSAYVDVSNSMHNYNVVDVDPGVLAPFVPNDSTLISWEVWGETPIAPTSSDTLRLQTIIRF